MGSVDIVTKKIVNVLNSGSLNSASVIFNGRYMIRFGRIVHVMLNGTDESDKSQLTFYYRDARRKTSGSHSYNKVSFPDNFLSSLVDDICADDLFGVSACPGVDGSGASLNLDAGRCHISVDAEMGLLIIESVLYSAVRSVIESNSPDGVSFKFGNIMVPYETVTRLRRRFMDVSYTNYGNLVFSTKSNKFVSRLRKRTKDFYSVQQAFVPVFVDYPTVFNPLKHDGIFNRSSLYRMAVEKNRLVKRGSLSCYYLTHIEICKALSMRHFMRFTPSFLYYFHLGLLFPSNPDFPALNRDVYVSPLSEDGRVTRISSQEFESAVKKALNEVNSPELSEEAKADYKKKIDYYSKFRKHSSLLLFCADNQRILKNIGSIGLDSDNAKTAQAYFEYTRYAKEELIGG